jgi:hypothetical protein
MILDRARRRLRCNVRWAKISSWNARYFAD